MNDKVKRCRNCGELLRAGDKYCMCCGTSRGQGTYSPSRMEIVTSPIFYGPPLKKKIKCKHCGYEGIETTPPATAIMYCPRCGKSIEEVWSKPDWDFFENLYEEEPLTLDEKNKTFLEMLFEEDEE